MYKPHEKLSGRQHTLWIAFLLAALLCPMGLLVTAPNSIGVIILTLLLSIVCFRLAWLHWNKHTNLSVPSLNLR